jgi:hypothetical protein
MPAAAAEGWHHDRHRVHRRSRLSDAEMRSPAPVDRIVDFARTALPLLEWGWKMARHPSPIHITGRPPPKPDF